MRRYVFDIAGLKVFDSLDAVLPDTESARTRAIELARNLGKAQGLAGERCQGG
jgi:hypothetical protein